MNEQPLQITLTLNGERARRGVTIDAFENFLDHFLNALRYHYRASRAESVKRSGRPAAEEQAVTAFRLVEFRTGSGIAVLEPALSGDESSGSEEILADVPTLAWENVSALLNAMESERPLESAVVVELGRATRALGEHGRFSIEYRSRGHVRRRQIDEAWLALASAPGEQSSPIPSTISGVLHAVDLEPDKVGIRTATGLDWTCHYPPELETDVRALLGSRVWARGQGHLVSARNGVLELESIDATTELEQTELFTGPPVPIAELIERQGLAAPQGLLALADPEWTPGAESDLFLEALQD